MYKINYLFLILIILLNTACVSKKVEEKTNITKQLNETNINNFQEKKYGVNIKYPENWTLLENFKGNIAVLIPGKESVENGEITNYINVKEEDIIDYDIDLEEYARLMKEQIKNKSQDFLIKEEKNYLKEGQEYKFIKFEGKENGKDYKGIHIYSIKNDRAYMFVFMFKKVDFNKHERNIEKLINSIEIKEVEREILNTNPPLSEFEDYKNNEHDFEMKYPKNWKTVIDENKETVFTVYAPIENEYDDVWENISVNIDDLTGMGLYIEEYAEIAYNNVNKIFKGKLKLLDSKKIEINGEKGLKVLYGVGNGTQELLFMQVYFIKGIKGYVVNFSSTVDTYSRYIGVADKIFNSFKIISEEDSNGILMRNILLNFRRLNYQKSINDANKLLEKDTNNLDAYIYRAESYKILGDYEKAEQDYKTLINISKSEEYINKAYMGLGSVEYLKNNYDTSLEYFLKVSEIDKNLTYLNYMLANIYYKKKLYQEALKFYTKVINSKGDEYIESLLGRSDVYYTMKNYQKAYEDLSVIIDINPKALFISTIYNNRACNLRYLGKAEKAMQDVKMAIQIDPNNVYAYTTLGELYADMGDKEKFFEYIKKAEDLDKEIIKNLDEYYTEEEPKLKILLDEYKKMDTH